MTKIKMLVMGALMAGVVAAAPAMADETRYLHSEYGYQNDAGVKKAPPAHRMKMHYKKKHHHKKMKAKHYRHAASMEDNYPDECAKPPCKGTSD